MTKQTDSSMPEQMATINNLLNLVSSELFATLDHSERCLEMFILERQSYNSLQQFIHALHQIRGTLTLIEITGAAELAETMLQCAGEIPSGADTAWDNHLSVLSESIFILRHYLENFNAYPCMLPELLIPAINQLRQIINATLLTDSHFTDIPTKCEILPFQHALQTDSKLLDRLRQMYQIGLLGLIRDENKEASLRMMIHAMGRLQHDTDTDDASRLCWVASAALKSFQSSHMTAYPSRKRLFSRVDQQLKKIQTNKQPLDRVLLKDLLYLISLDNHFDTTSKVVQAFNLLKSPVSNELFEAEVHKLKGPNQNAICSFTAAIKEELNHTKATIDNFSSQQTNHSELVDALVDNINQLIKTLSLVDLQQAEIMLREQIGILKIHQHDEQIDDAILERLAEVILHVDSIIISFENNSCVVDKSDIRATPIVNDAIGNQYLQQGRSLAIQEALTGLSSVQQSIVGYVESNGDKQYIEKTLQSIDEIYGSLLFLNQDRAATIIDGCRRYIEREMIQTHHVPNSYQLDNLADILTSLEFYMETNTSGAIDNRVLDLADESLAALLDPTVQKTSPPIPIIEDAISLAEAEYVDPPVLGETFLVETPDSVANQIDTPEFLSTEIPTVQEPAIFDDTDINSMFDRLTLTISPTDASSQTESIIAPKIIDEKKPKEKIKKVTIPTLMEEEHLMPGYKNWTVS